ncbi:MAG: C40 family peptidase [Pseudomonadota bacterium]
MAWSKERGGSATNPGSFLNSQTPKTIFAGAILMALVLLAPVCWANTTAPKVKSILKTARGLLGVPYRSGGDRPEIGFDCSGFVSFVLGQNGIDLGRSSPEQFKHGQKISRSELHPGDLVFFAHSQVRKVKVKAKGKSKSKIVAKARRVSHVGIYIGNGEFIHAASGNRRIQVNELSEDYWARHFYGARRI